jgi:plasmid stability protein
VFDPPERLRLALRLRAAPDGRSLSGEVHDLVSGRRESLTVLRR